MKLRQLLLCVLGPLVLIGCDNFKVPTVQKDQKSISLVSAGGSTYLLESETHKVFTLSNGEFVEVPIVDQASISGKNGLRYYHDEVKDMDVSTNLKFFNGKLFYVISVSPAWTPEYASYFTNMVEALRTKKAPPPEPQVKFKDPNWIDKVDKLGNLINVELEDSDGFAVKRISLPLAGGGSAMRTGIVDKDGVTRTMVKFEGSEEITGGDFGRIKGSDVTYVIN